MHTPADPRTDDELVAAARNGDEHAFESLYRRHRDRVVTWARRQGLDGEAALDVLQEAFFYVARKLPTLRLSSSLAALLHPVVRHLCWKHLERRKRTELASEDPAAIAAAEVEHGSEGSEREAELASLIAQLPAAQRDVLLLRFVDELALDEIAVALEIPIGTVKSRLHLAIRALREDPRTKSWFAARES